VGAVAATKEREVKKVYGLAAFIAGGGVLVSLAASILGIVALRYGGIGVAQASVFLGMIGVVCVGTLTAYFLYQLTKKQM
jgi:hypothetical protein